MPGKNRPMPEVQGLALGEGGKLFVQLADDMAAVRFKLTHF